MYLPIQNFYIKIQLSASLSLDSGPWGNLPLFYTVFTIQLIIKDIQIIHKLGRKLTMAIS